MGCDQNIKLHTNLCKKVQENKIGNKTLEKSFHFLEIKMAKIYRIKIPHLANRII